MHWYKENKSFIGSYITNRNRERIKERRQKKKDKRESGPREKEKTSEMRSSDAKGINMCGPIQVEVSQEKKMLRKRLDLCPCIA